MPIRLDLQKILEVAQNELAGLTESPDQRTYLIDRALVAFDRHFEPLDVPGPDVVIDPALRAMIPGLVGALYDQWLVDETARRTKEAGK